MIFLNSESKENDFSLPSREKKHSERMKFLQLADSEKVELINQLHEENNLPQVIIEKDVWVTAVLRALFALPYAENLSFKGGTSLSKCYKFD